MDKEIWKPVKGYEGVYEVSNLGNVRRLLPNGRVRQISTPKRSHRGYLVAHLSVNNEQRCASVHRLVAEAFIPNPSRLPQVNHKNENKADNRVENLEWCTAQYNINYGTGHDRRIATKRNDKRLSFPIGQFSMSGDLIRIYPSMKEAARTLGVSVHQIRRCAEGIRRTYKRADGSIYVGEPPKQAHGFIWKLIKDL